MGALLQRPDTGAGRVDLPECDQMIHVNVGRVPDDATGIRADPQAAFHLAVRPESDGHLAIPDEDLLACVLPVPIIIDPVWIIAAVIGVDDETKRISRAADIFSA